EGVIVSSHTISRCNGAKGEYGFVGAFVPHDTHCVYRKQNAECLPDFIVKTSLADFVDIDGICLSERVCFFPSDGTGNADGKPWTGEWMAPNEGLRQAKFAAERAHLILEQLAQRFDQFHFH